jgi:hypothetical protein
VARRTATTRVYNLSVADVHTYYVVAGKATVLTHNEDVPKIPCLPKVGEKPRKTVNSNMAHVDDARAQRAGYANAQEAQQAVRDLSARVDRDGFPEGTIPDTARSDRVLVPIGSNGYAVYQIKPNGNAVFKTILEKR